MTPDVLDRFPRFPLVHGATPLQPLPRLEALLGGPRLLVKRDDCTGLAFGGNKTRKLEFLLGEARQTGATVLVTEGGLQSNHARQTAAAAAKAGLKCHLVLEDAVPINNPVYRSNGNILLDRMLGAVSHASAPGEGGSRRDRLLSELRSKGEVPCHIPLGGSTATGALGYVSAMLELLEQAQSAAVTVDRIVVASGSGGTQAGLIVGKALAGSAVRITGIDIGGRADWLVGNIEAVANGCALKLGLDRQFSHADIEIVRGYVEPGYGLPNPGMIEAVKQAALQEGLFLDPVYTGKAMAGLIGMVRSGSVRTDETVVFLHTGGTPALFAYPDIF